MTGDRAAFAHDAVLAMAPDGDERAPGGAVTLALCGGWSHEGPCPLAPHHTAAWWDADRLRVRVLFAARPEDEARVRALVRGALAAGGVQGPDGVRSSWRLVSDRPGTVAEGERVHAGRLVAG
ncbi:MULTISPECIES: hypothetical protein [unclassified Blastococcus]